MSERDFIEFHLGEATIAAVNSSMVPPEGSFINIRGETYVVELVTFALDYEALPLQRRMCCHVNLAVPTDSDDGA